VSELTKLLEEQIDILRKSAEPNLATLTRLAVDALVLARQLEMQQQNAIGLAALEPSKYERAGRKQMFDMVLRATNGFTASVTNEWLLQHERDLLNGQEPNR
jgi:hypothetical protein